VITRHTLSLTLLCLAPSLACAPDDDGCDGHTEDEVFGRGIHSAEHALTESGRWHIPAGTMAIGDTQDVDYLAAPPFDGGDNCSGGATDGALFLRDELLEYFDQIDSIGIYNCRVIAGTNSMSLHGVGRALDVMISPIGGDADNGDGDPIGNWLIENAEAIGIQTIIWDHTIWRVTYDPREHQLSSGANPHVDHLHVEIGPQAANMNLPWYSDPYGPGPVVPCEALPAGGGVVDEDSPCFDVHGPGQYWRAESGVGNGGGLLWTNAFENDEPSNWAEWKIPVTASGDYDVQVYLDPAHARF
jgi:hypothetical protein